MSEKPLPLPLIATASNRGSLADIDARLINGYVEKTLLDGLWCYKRPGLVGGFNPGGAGGGVTYWNQSTYSVLGSALYKESSSIGAVIAPLASQRYNFAGSLGATPLLFLQTTGQAYTTDGTTVTQVTDADYPATTVPGAVYIDGTTYVMTPEAYILGSDLNDPTSWDPLNSIRVQIDPGYGVAIAKQLNYLVAFKDFSVEVFYDAKNAAGSPLGRVDAAKLSIGCADAESIAELDGALIWVAQSKKGLRTVMLMEGLKAKRISTPAVERLLQGDFGSFGSAVHTNGHRFYLLTLLEGTAPSTLVYDFDEDLWFQWFSATDGSLRIKDISFSSSGIATVQLIEGGNYYFDPESYADSAGVFSWDLYTPNFDADTRLGKVVNKLEVTADQQHNSMLEVRWSDDDYKTWSSPQVLDLSLKQAWITKLGTFVKRAHHFHQKLDVPLRVKAVNLHIDLCTL